MLKALIKPKNFEANLIKFWSKILSSKLNQSIHEKPKQIQKKDEKNSRV